MPIPKKDINTNVIQITSNETVEEVLMWLPADRTARAFCYVVLAVEAGRYIVVPWIEIEQIAARMRQDVSSMRIAGLDGLPPPVTAIERYGVSIHWAREANSALVTGHLPIAKAARSTVCCGFSFWSESGSYSALPSV